MNNKSDESAILPVLGVIPARYGSTRLPAKAMADIDGKPMVVRVYEQACKAGLSKVVVATDSTVIADACVRFGVDHVMTRDDHQSGTDRVAEVARKMEKFAYIVNIQGDEPMIAPELIRAVAAELMPSPVPGHIGEAADGLVQGPDMTTASRAFDIPEDALSPDVVKVVTDHCGNALYFSRLPIPFSRDTADGLGAVTRFKHVGIYGYTREALLKLSSLPPAPLELAEKLEQLRALANGMTIRVVQTAHDSIGVDTADDLCRVRGLFKQNFQKDDHGYS